MTKPPSTGASPWTETTWGTLIVGDGAFEVVREAGIRSEEGRLVTPAGRPMRYALAASEPPAGAGLPPGGVGVIRVEGAAVRVAFYAPDEPGNDPIADLVPPAGLVARTLAGVRLVVGADSRARAAVAISALVSRDPGTATRILAKAGDEPGVRLLRAWAALLARDVAATHAALKGLGADADVGGVARLLTGAAMRLDGHAAEAVIDFEAAAGLGDLRGPGSLLAAEAYESDQVRLPEKAATAYAAAFEAMPQEPAAVLGLAFYRARAKDAAAGIAVLEPLLASKPDLVAGWRLRARLEAADSTAESLHAAAASLDRAASLAPKDPRSWIEVGDLRWRMGEAGQGPDAYLAAAQAFGRATELDPRDARAWHRRGAAIAEAALETPLLGDASVFRARLDGARACYAQAAAAGLAGADLTRMLLDLGKLLDVLPPATAPSPTSPAPSSSNGLPSTPRDAYAAAASSDPASLEAATAALAACVAVGDGFQAERALAALPSSLDKAERGVLEAAVAWSRGEKDRARQALSGPGGVALSGNDGAEKDLQAELASALLVLGHERAALAVVEADERRADRLSLRVRARAALRDPEGLRTDLNRLETIDPAAAKALRTGDPWVRAVLDPAPK